MTHLTEPDWRLGALAAPDTGSIQCFIQGLREDHAQAAARAALAVPAEGAGGAPRVQLSNFLTGGALALGGSPLNHYTGGGVFGLFFRLWQHFCCAEKPEEWDSAEAPVQARVCAFLREAWFPIMGALAHQRSRHPGQARQAGSSPPSAPVATPAHVGASARGSASQAQEAGTYAEVTARRGSPQRTPVSGTSAHAAAAAGAQRAAGGWTQQNGQGRPASQSGRAGSCGSSGKGLQSPPSTGATAGASHSTRSRVERRVILYNLGDYIRRAIGKAWRKSTRTDKEVVMAAVLAIVPEPTAFSAVEYVWISQSMHVCMDFKTVKAAMEFVDACPRLARAHAPFLRAKMCPDRTPLRNQQAYTRMEQTMAALHESRARQAPPSTEEPPATERPPPRDGPSGSPRGAEEAKEELTPADPTASPRVVLETALVTDASQQSTPMDLVLANRRRNREDVAAEARAAAAEVTSPMLLTGAQDGTMVLAEVHAGTMVRATEDPRCDPPSPPLSPPAKRSPVDTAGARSAAASCPDADI